MEWVLRRPRVAEQPGPVPSARRVPASCQWSTWPSATSRALHDPHDVGVDQDALRPRRTAARLLHELREAGSH